jgi:thioredoxin:protein disulfide reductase
VRRFVHLAAVLLIAVATPAAAERVFQAEASWPAGPPAPGATAVLRIELDVRPGWHVNSNAPRDPYLVPTTVSLDLPAGWTAAAPSFPPARDVKLSFSDTPLAVFAGRVQITVAITAAAASPGGVVRGAVEAQACNDKVCMAPDRAPFEVALATGPVPTSPSGPASGAAAAAPATPAAAPPQPPAAAPAPVQPAPPAVPAGFAGHGLLLQLAIVFLAGLALNLTPCVYPLIPITVGFFAAQDRESRARTWLLAVVYVLGMSATYSALGVAAALSGRLFGSALQSPWVVGLIVVVLLALAASMFGLWELRVPAWATRASGGRAGAGGALLMGLLVGLVAAPCIGPFVLGLLTYVGQRQDVALGFALFFVLSLGLGLPYLLLGVFTGAIDRLPNSGAWMLGVRQLFGVLLVALAAYFSRPLLPPGTGEALFAVVLAAGGLYLLVVARPGHEQPWIDRFMRLASAAVLVAGIVLFPARTPRGAAEISWQPYDEAAVERAMAAGRPVVLDFFATWCVPCKELDEKTFSDPAVEAQLSGFARFKVDLTAGDPATDRLRRRYDVAGVPTVAFFRGAREVQGTRLTGFEPPAAFLARLRLAEGR